MTTRLTCLALFCALSTASIRAEEWPGWRGPRGDGTSAEKNIPVRWSQSENIAWKTPIPGKGHSSPIVWGDRIFVTSCIEETGERVLLCLDRRDGKVCWQRVVLTAKLEKLHRLNSRASSTPATDGRHVYVSFLDAPRMEVFCYDVDGKKVWQHSPGEFHSVHGFCSPPTLYKDMVILNGDQDAVAWIVALDKATGEERWRADRPNRTRSYCPPLLVEAAGKKQLVLSGSKCVASYDPDTGKQIWIIDGPTEQYVASLGYHEGLLFLTAGFPTFHLMGIRRDGLGNVTDTHVVWHNKPGERGAAYVPSPIAWGDYLFVVSDLGFASCLEAKTGKRIWFERLGNHHSASPVSAQGRLYFLSDDGVMYVLKAGPTFEVLSKNELREECYALPAVSHGQIFVRTLHSLHCIGPAIHAQSKAAK